MCGIVGYTGINQVLPSLLKGLEKLEYRGYDSAGVYVSNGAAGDFLIREKGRVSKLEAATKGKGIAGTAGIAHTRWATHGGVSVENAHPHMSEDGRFYLVHNGVIENYDELRDTYLQGVTLHSETDTEIAVQLIDKFSKEDQLSTLDAFRKMIALLDDNSAYGFLLMDRETPNLMYAAKKKSPLLIGVSDSGNVVTSDAAAMLDVTQNFIELMDGEVAIIDKAKVTLFDAAGQEITREAFHIDIDASETDKGVYPYYMLKEVDEQAIVARTLSQHYFDDDNQIQNIDPAIIEAIKSADRLYIVAAGTSYHAGLVGKRYFEQWTGKPTEVHISSEFAYDQPLLSDKPFFIFLSQSGETADSREVLDNVIKQGFGSLTIANVMNSTLTREADFALPLLAGPEIAVASTKAYTAQIIVEAILAHAAGNSTLDLKHELAKVAVEMQVIIDQKEAFKTIAESALRDRRSAFYIGRGLDAAVAVEAALKLKEISYVQTEGFAAGELKHGTISLIEEGTPVFALLTQTKTAGLVRGEIAQVTARGANAVIISSKALAKAGDAYVLPEVNELLMPLLTVIPAQLIAYYATLDRGLDVDRPRNLAKSVTVQ
ncbi:glutamine--fructose-6-phosphate transaminase (isomerizing) [Leuconostoc citreum]|mgnify:FL=1|uniref:glutamine--fructose-6-phosphate transaminase (isomerizing) n=1 Tax=Leuconostoc citreum TaxID=33964 RepID=UPI0002465E83|nr:glutamine--fructose-6-phosphate transaminase (isomerizing) [Leuconostoc citreum]MCS8586713.1 glutamine--fructose-6-phosphate transaminase (isomerizing) [Leuconostoc citreum]MCS8594738.1 glutamine--fructose-6-phosphate transaminase (isomerizing) [Leuconostoc citreum]MCS8598854.1 glutamine--fructose-6-phosphate transaminase (isomerizing) [Leuconostoc citreum]TOY70308.1 glutamine--fructose-6-phosphate transaminase (isomerizing) [Leuconostoc citreum]CCF25455.1 Glucosamine--fructose-6-phosphate 